MKENTGRNNTVRRKSSRQARKNTRTGLLFASPWIIGFVCFTIYPICMAFYYSFTNYDLFGKCDWVGLANYKTLFGDTYVWKSLKNTMYVVLLGTPMELIVALLLAMLLNQKKALGLPIFRTLFYLPSLVPVVASTMLFVWVLNGNFGLLNQILAIFGVKGPYWLNDPRFTKLSLILMDTWRCGGSMIIFLAALRSVPASLYEAAELDGASGRQMFFRITLPYISPTIEFLTVMGMINRFQYFSQAYVFEGFTGSQQGTVGGGPSNSLLFYCLYLYRQAFEYYKMGYACALAIILFIIILAATMLMMRMSEQLVNYDVE